METCIVRQPIMDNNNVIYAYEVLYSEPPHANFSIVDAAASTIENFLLQVNDDSFTNGKMVFLTFTPNLILKNVPKIFMPNKLVIQIDDTTVVNPLALKMVQKYKMQGYKIAVNSFDFSARNFALLDNIDIIKLDFSKGSKESFRNIINVGKSFKKTIIACNINTAEAFELAQELEIMYMQGSCVAEKLSSRVFRAGHMQSNFFQLMVAITRDEPEIDEIEQIIARDVTLTFSLIKLVNSAYFALRNQVKSVRQALIILGLGQLKQWVYLLSFKNETIGELESEIIKMSFLRASFATELYEYIKNPGISRSEAYLLGIFSMLDLLMQTDIKSVIDELGLSTEVKKGLTEREGVCGKLLDLILSYEKADWPLISQFANELNIPIHIITQKYFECVESVNIIWKGIMDPKFESDIEPAGNEIMSNPLTRNALEEQLTTADEDIVDNKITTADEDRPVHKITTADDDREMHKITTIGEDE